MSVFDVQRAVKAAESAPQSGDPHVHNFGDLYSSMLQMQQHDRNHPGQFGHDVHEMNDRLHAKGMLPNLDIVGVDQHNHQLLTRDRSTGETTAQDANHVNDHGKSAGHSSDHPPDRFNSQPTSAEGLRLSLIAQAFGIHVQPLKDGGYEVQDPFSNPQVAAMGFMHQLLDGMLFGSPERYSGAPLGMNPILAQAWRGFPNDPPKAEAPDDSQPSG